MGRGHSEAEGLRRWATEVMDSTPARKAVNWLMDVNAKLGVTKGMYGPEPPGDAVGDGCPEVESVNRGLLREWMNQQHLLTTNTHTQLTAHDGLPEDVALRDWVHPRAAQRTRDCSGACGPASP